MRELEATLLKGRWIQQPSSATATTVVFIHGFGSSSEGTWRHATGTYWPDLIAGSFARGAIGVLTFDYTTGVDSQTFSVDDAADTLHEVLRSSGVLKSGAIAFVAHSLGGLVARRYLVKRAPDLETVRIDLLLVASPTLGSDWANRATPLNTLLGNVQVSSMRRGDDNVWLSGLKSDFDRCRDRYEITGRELLEDRPLLQKLRLGKVVLAASAGVHFTEALKIGGSDHSSIAKLASADDLQNTILMGRLRDLHKRRWGVDLPERLLKVDPRGGAAVTFAQRRVVNAPPVSAPKHFEDRTSETGLIADFICDEAYHLMTVQGPGGVGKTALVCRALRRLELGQPLEGDASLKAAGIVYINATDRSAGLFPLVVRDLWLTLEPSTQGELAALVENAGSTVAATLKPILDRLPADPTLILVDNFEDALSPEGGQILDDEMASFFEVLCEHPGHNVKAFVTSRTIPSNFAAIDAGRQQVLRLQAGLPSPFAERVLRTLDRDGTAGLKGADDALLSRIREQTHGLPRAMEAFWSKLVFEGLHPEELLSRLRVEGLAAEQVSQSMVADAHRNLAADQKRTLAILATFGKPASLDAIAYVLREWAPAADCRAILDGLRAMRFVRQEGPEYYMHRIDRDHAISDLSEIERKEVRELVDDYFDYIAKPRDEWTTLADVEPRIEQFRLRLEARESDRAAEIVRSISDFLDRHGGFQQLMAMAEALLSGLDDPRLEAEAREWLVRGLWRAGRFSDAIAHQRRIAELIDETGSDWDRFLAHGNLLIYRESEQVDEDILDEFRDTLYKVESEFPYAVNARLTVIQHLGSCLSDLGHMEEACARKEEALRLAKQLDDINSIEAESHNLASVLRDVGRLSEAEELFESALLMADESGNPLWRSNHLAALANCDASRGQHERAVVRLTEAIEIRRGIGDLGGVAHGLRSLAWRRFSQGAEDEALNVLQAAVEQAVDLRLSLYPFQADLGGLLVHLDRIEEATAHLERAILDPLGSNWRSHTLLGVCALRRSQVREARTQFEEAQDQAELWLSRSDLNPSAHKGRALALFGLAACGQKAAAKRSAAGFRRACEFDVGQETIRIWGSTAALVAPFTSVEERRIVESAIEGRAN